MLNNIRHFYITKEKNIPRNIIAMPLLVNKNYAIQFQTCFHKCQRVFMKVNIP